MAVQSLERAEAELAVGDVIESRAQAAVAAALARRSFLPGEDGTWVEDRRRDLHEVLVRALECRRDAAMQAGDLTEAVRHGEEVTELEPYRESAYRALMQAHAAAGNPAEALRVYDRCRRFLSEELGAYPPPETVALYREVLQDDRREPEAATPAPVPAADVPGADVPRRGSRGRLVLAVGTMLVAGAAAWLTLWRGEDAGGALMPGDAVAAFDESGRAAAPIAVGAPPTHIVAGTDGAVWVGSSSTGTVRRIDPERGVVVQTTSTGGSVDGLATGAGSVWVANAETGRLLRISSETNAIVQSIDVPNGPRGVALGEGGVWVTGLYARTLTGSIPRADAACGPSGSVGPRSASPPPPAPSG